MAVRKASFNLPDEELDALRRLAAERNVSVTQALRQAIHDSTFIEEQLREKNKLLIERRDGTIREVSVLR
jgi:predicted transcriptional regulator